MFEYLAYPRFARSRAVAASMALAIAIFLLLPIAAKAQTKYNGAQPAVFSGGDVFSVSGNTITISAASTASYLDVNGGGVEQLLGISGIWIVDGGGNSISGPGTLTGDGFVTGTSPQTNWAAQSGPAGYGGTTGYSPHGSWIDLVSNATLGTYGKSTDGFTSGSFTFTGSGLPSSYDIGIDYLIADGAGNTSTGRAYFGLPGPTDVAPESGSLMLFCAGAVVLLGMASFVRRRSVMDA